MRPVQSPTASRASFAGSIWSHRAPRFPVVGRPQAGFIYDFPLLLEEVLLSKGITAPAGAIGSVSRRQKTSLSTLERRSLKAGKQGRMRPCLVLRADNIGNADLVLLSTLGDGFHPTAFCCSSQHFLIPVNKTPDWPTPDCFRVNILPDWPNGNRCYVLGVRFQTASPHYGQWERPKNAPQDPIVPYRVELQDTFRILSHCDHLEETCMSWPPGQRRLFNATYKTHDELRRKILKLNIAHTPADLNEITHLYNQHMSAAAIANGKHWAGVSNVPLQVIPVEARAFFAGNRLLANTKAFHSDYPARTSPDEQAKQIHSIEHAVRALSVRPKSTNESSSEILAEVLFAIITVASKTVESDAPRTTKMTFVHPSFSDADLDLLAAVINDDQKLAKELHEVRLGYFSRASSVLNYVCQMPSPD